MGLTCVGIGFGCRGEAAGFADAATPRGRRLKPLCEHHFKRFKEGLVRSRRDMGRNVVRMGGRSPVEWVDYLERLHATRALPLEEGLDLARASPGLLVVPDGGGDAT